MDKHVAGFSALVINLQYISFDNTNVPYDDAVLTKSMCRKEYPKMNGSSLRIPISRLSTGNPLTRFSNC